MSCLLIISQPRTPLPPDSEGSDTSPIAPQGVNAPMTLRATVSSISPSRSGRAFRISNQCQQKPEVESIDNASFSRNILDAEKTPSPVSVPLPLSIPPKKMQWDPYNQPGFVYALAIATSDQGGVRTVHQLLSRKGGFRMLWGALALPSHTAPPANHQTYTDQEAADMIQHAWNTCKTARVGLDPCGWSPFQEIAFPGALLSVEHTWGLKFVHEYLARLGGFRKLWDDMGLPENTAPAQNT